MYDFGEIYLITDDKLDFEELYNKCALAIKSGVRLLQYRKKEGSFKERYNEAIRLKELCIKNGCKLLINDRVDVALAVDADGVHMGQDDMDVTIARRLLGKNKIIGVTAKTTEQAIKAFNGGANYLGVGALFPSRTKKDAKGITIETLKGIKKSVSIPVYGIGGITSENLTAEIVQNVDGICAISAILTKEDTKAAVEQFIVKLKDLRNK